MNQNPNDISPNDFSKFFSEIGQQVSEHLLKRGSRILWKGPPLSIYQFKLESFYVSDIKTELRKLTKENNNDILGFDTRLLRLGADLIEYSITHILKDSSYK